MKNRRQYGEGWTLFLDRDGVINEELLGSYVTKWEDFKFSDRALEAIQIASRLFARVIVVTNQRGVGKGIMSMEDLRIIHTKMNACIQASGGSIHHVYTAIATETDDHNRKPNIGMGLQAASDFEDIDFNKSVMIGNSPSDMEFGKRLGMYTIFITSKHDVQPAEEDLVDEAYLNLYEWAKQLQTMEELVH